MTEPLLQTVALAKRFGALVATDNVSLSVMPGEMHALIGPNGAGKTTLIRALAGLLPAEGRLELEGRPLRDFSARQRARRIGHARRGHSRLEDETGAAVGARLEAADQAEEAARDLRASARPAEQIGGQRLDFRC